MVWSTIKYYYNILVDQHIWNSIDYLKLILIDYLKLIDKTGNNSHMCNSVVLK